jgi:SAM-dependent methyltransferase
VAHVTDKQWDMRSVVPDDAMSSREIDTTKPHIARIYDFWLGGKDNFEVDRAAGTRAAEANPALYEGVRGNRAFLARSVRYLAGEVGVTQFLDLGTGIPAANNTHEVAHAVASGSHVVYVDNDPIVLAHARALLTGVHGETAYLDADIRDTAKVLEAAARTLDFSRPVGVMMIAVLHCLTDEDDPWGVVREVMRAVPPGSYLALTHPGNDFHPEAADAMLAKLNPMMPQKITFRSREQVLRFFDGLELVEPGLIRAPEWHPDSPEDVANPAEMWAGVARKP